MPRTLLEHRRNSEKTLEAKLCRAIEKMGGRALKFASSTETGYPDRIILLPGGRIYFAEIKTQGQKPRPLQEARIEELRALGFHVFVIDSAELLTITLNLFLYELSTSTDRRHL